MAVEETQFHVHVRVREPLDCVHEEGGTVPDVCGGLAWFPSCVYGGRM